MEKEIIPQFILDDIDDICKLEKISLKEGKEVITNIVRLAYREGMLQSMSSTAKSLELLTRASEHINKLHGGNKL